MTRDFFRSASTQDVQSCLAAGKSVAERNEAGETPLHLAAAAARDAGLVRVLLENGADGSSTTADGLTPLHMAAAESSTPSTIAYLVLWGTDPSVRVSGSQACSSLTRKVSTCATTPLHLAAQRKDGSEFIAALVTAGADVDAMDDAEKAPLHHAASAATPIEVALLLQGGASANQTDKDGSTALHQAPKNTPAAHDIVKVLIAAGGDVDKKRSDSTTPLIMAAYYAKDPKVFAELVRVSNDPCYVTDKEQSALSGIRFNDHLTTDRLYWVLHEECSSK